MRRYFVKVFSANRVALRSLQSFGFDLFHPTVGQAGETRFTIDGLLRLDEIERLVLAGYQVLVEEESSRRARGPRETIEFGDWLEARTKNRTRK